MMDLCTQNGTHTENNLKSLNACKRGILEHMQTRKHAVAQVITQQIMQHVDVHSSLVCSTIPLPGRSLPSDRLFWHYGRSTVAPRWHKDSSDLVGSLLSILETFSEAVLAHTQRTPSQTRITRKHTQLVGDTVWRLPRRNSTLSPLYGY